MNSFIEARKAAALALRELRQQVLTPVPAFLVLRCLDLSCSQCTRNQLQLSLLASAQHVVLMKQTTFLRTIPCVGRFGVRPNHPLGQNSCGMSLARERSDARLSVGVQVLRYLGEPTRARC